eukprot:1576727-Amphidinium_carterae.1
MADFRSSQTSAANAYALVHATDVLHHRAVKVDYPNPSSGENVGILHSRDKHNLRKSKALDPRGCMGFLLSDPWWTDVTHILVKDEGRQE